MSSSKPKLLWVSDACVPTGFARVTHNVLGWLGSRWERVVLGVNATGDPHHYPYPVFPARVGGDMWGFGRFAELVKRERPDIVCIQSDVWIVETFLEIAAQIENCPPICAFMPVDASGMKRSVAANLSKLSLAAFYSSFALEQAYAAGFDGNGCAIGLGVATELYRPVPKAEARRKLLPEIPPGAFVVGNVNRNQPRKHLDLTIAYFAEWLRRGGDGYLYLHCVRDDIGWDLQSIADYYDLGDRFWMPKARSIDEMLPESAMPTVYSALDLQVSTCMGEGFGLTHLEAMACGTPQLLPDFAALGEWPRGAVELVPVNHGEANVGQRAFGIGATPDREAFIAALDRLSRDRDELAALSAKAIERAQEPRFQWAEVAKCFDQEFSAVLNGRARAAA